MSDEYADWVVRLRDAAVARHPALSPGTEYEAVEESGATLWILRPGSSTDYNISKDDVEIVGLSERR